MDGDKDLSGGVSICGPVPGFDVFFLFLKVFYVFLLLTFGFLRYQFFFFFFQRFVFLFFPVFLSVFLGASSFCAFLLEGFLCVSADVVMLISLQGLLRFVFVPDLWKAKSDDSLVIFGAFHSFSMSCFFP